MLNYVLGGAGHGDRRKDKRWVRNNNKLEVTRLTPVSRSQDGDCFLPLSAATHKQMNEHKQTRMHVDYSLSSPLSYPPSNADMAGLAGAFRAFSLSSSACFRANSA